MNVRFVKKITIIATSEKEKKSTFCWPVLSGPVFKYTVVIASDAERPPRWEILSLIMNEVSFRFDIE